MLPLPWVNPLICSPKDELIWPEVWATLPELSSTCAAIFSAPEPMLSMPFSAFAEAETNASTAFVSSATASASASCATRCAAPWR
jgi:hypothetical protein